MGDKAHHRAGLGELLVERAYAVIDEQGPEAVSMRALARELGVSSGAPFRHFPDRKCLIDAVIAEATIELQDRLDEAAASAEDTLTQFRAVTVAYVRFAAEHPALFRLVHGYKPVTEEDLFAGREHERRANMIALIIEGQNAGLVPDEDPGLIEFTMEALAYGLAHMAADYHPRVYELGSEDLRSLALAATQLLQTGIGLV